MSLSSVWYRRVGVRQLAKVKRPPSSFHSVNNHINAKKTLMLGVETTYGENAPICSPAIPVSNVVELHPYRINSATCNDCKMLIELMPRFK